MKKVVTVIDYGMGNLFSICNAVKYCGAEVFQTSNPEDVRNAQVMILPGVGAFADGMRGLADKKLVTAIRDYASSGGFLLGICLGMQMLLDCSEEFGTHSGLGLIPGKVELIPNTGSNGVTHKIPHIGWNQLIKPKDADWSGTILHNISPQTKVYFVHSYTAVPKHEADRLADCDYNGQRISAAIQRGNIYGCQFHPEKSGPIGLKILESFINL